jgi:hypothetical protein
MREAYAKQVNKVLANRLALQFHCRKQTQQQHQGTAPTVSRGLQVSKKPVGIVCNTQQESFS